MSYYCSICDRTIKYKSKNKHFKSLTHKSFDKFIRLNHTIQNPKFFDVDKMFNDYIIIHKRKIELDLIGADFKRDFGKDLVAHITTDFTVITSRFNLKQ